MHVIPLACGLHNQEIVRKRAGLGIGEHFSVGSKVIRNSDIRKAWSTRTRVTRSKDAARARCDSKEWCLPMAGRRFSEYFQQLEKCNKDR